MERPLLAIEPPVPLRFVSQPLPPTVTSPRPFLTSTRPCLPPLRHIYLYGAYPSEYAPVFYSIVPAPMSVMCLP